ncbi:hypothetical protein MCP1_730004 [Candidatus Terasakiella magnetica]|nr:hypothetical protein MCP1_730004 [Candidatus Terasakiella magnetica]
MSFENAISIGLRSGEYGGRNRMKAPRARMIRSARGLLWAARLSRIKAAIGDNGAVLGHDIKIFSPKARPLVGEWTQEAKVSCEGKVVTDSSLKELIFKADGTFQVTWVPFEIYSDYSGTYATGPNAQDLALTVKGGNWVPPDIKARGRFEVVGDVLTLKGIWLGSQRASKVESGSACGMVFHRAVS